MLIGACQGLSKVSELERVTVVAEPQITENSGTVSQENSLENEPPKNNGETEDTINYTENDENISSIETPLELQTIVGTDNVEEESNSSIETTVPYGSDETFSGFYTIDGASLPITYTIGIENVVRGNEAYLEIQNSKPDVPAPSSGKEYVIFTIYFAYDSGEVDEISLGENVASSQFFSFYFALPGENANAENMTSYLEDSIYTKSLNKGESITGKVAFLNDENANGPLVFVGYGNSVMLSLN